MAEKTQKWTCPDCPKRFNTELSMARHFDKEHTKDVDPSFYDDERTTIRLIP